jgi:hypothetical protein
MFLALFALTTLEAGVLAFYFLFPAIAPLLLSIRIKPSERDSQLVIGPGCVTEKRALGLTLRARDVVGITTCTYDNRYALSVQMKRDPAPHTFVVNDEESLHRLRQALGGAHDGTGALAWPLQRDPREVGVAVASAVSSAVCLGFIGVVLSFAWPLMRAFPKKPEALYSIILGEEGVSWKWGGVRVFPYELISNASYYPESKSILLSSTDGNHMRIPVPKLGVGEARVIASQINGAARRTRGERVLRDSPLERVRALRREPNEPMRAWLTRLSAMAATVGGDDYRSVSVSKDDLWRIAEDPTETFEDRAGAGRVLLGSLGPDARVRVEEALANAHVPEKKLRVVLEDDLDRAADAITEGAEEERRLGKML